MALSFLRLTAITLAITSLVSCGNFLKPHRISIQQGNIITPQHIAKLEKGMTKRQVRYVMGTPLVVDSLSPDNWLYLYSYEHGPTGARLENRVKLRFENDSLVTIDTNIPQPADGETENITTANPAEQIAEQEREKLDKRVETEREDSIRDAGL